MAQPLPDWLKTVTLRYQDSDMFTTGLVELPISYSGPSIPLAWPYTSVSTDSMTAESPLSSAAPSSAEVVNFIDGSGPFTVLGDVILTAPPSTTSPPATSTTSMMLATPSPSVMLVSTIIIEQPTPSAEPSPNYPARPSPNPLALGFVILLTILIMIIFAVTVALIKCHRMRKKRVGMIGKHGDYSFKETHYEFNTGPHLSDHRGSPAAPTRTRNLNDHDDIPILIHQHTSVNVHAEDKELLQPENQFHIVPQRRAVSNVGIKWMPWKKLISKLSIFSNNNVDRAGILYNNPPVPQIQVHYSNPYHDPSVNTDTEERVSRWRDRCGSPSSSALHLPSTITSSKKDDIDDKAPQNGLSGNVQVLTMDSFGFNNRNQCAENDGVFNFNPSSTVSGPTVTIKRAGRGCQGLKDLSPSKVMRAEALHTLLECASPRRNVIKSESDVSNHFIAPGDLSKASARVSRSFRGLTRSSRTSGKASNSKRYSDDSPPLLFAECDAGALENDDTDPGDSPLDFITIPLRSPPRCRRGTSNTSPGTLTVIENSFDSLHSPQPLFPSSASLPLRFPSQLTSQKNENHHASPCPTLSSPAGSHKPQHDHIDRSKQAHNSSSHVASSSLDASTGVRDERGKLPIMKHPNSAFCTLQHLDSSPSIMDSSTRNRSSLDVHLDHAGSGSGSDKDKCSKNKQVFPLLNTTSNSLKLSSLDYQPATSDQPLVRNDTKRKTSEKNNSYNDEEIILNGYFGSGSIGNTGGVSELGILETSDRSLEIKMEFPTSVSGHCVQKSTPMQGESELIEGEGEGRILEHLFHVKPPFERVGIKASTKISFSRQPLNLPGAPEARDQKNEAGNDGLSFQQERNHSDSSARARSTYHSVNAGGSILQPNRRSASSSVLGSLLSFGQQSRRCVSFPSGMENEIDARNSNNYLSILPMLHDTRSPLQRITERWRQLSRNGEDDKNEAESESRHAFESDDEIEKGEDDEADENCGLLLSQHSSTSR